MKGALSLIAVAAVVYIFWVTYEYFKHKNKNNNK
jgi:hypothetical protein